MIGRRALSAAVVLVAWLGCVVSAAPTQDAERLDPAAGLFRAYHAPLQDLAAGRLYEPAVRLLDASRRMPERIDLGDAAAGDAPTEPPAPKSADVDEPASDTVPEPAVPPREDAVKVVDHAVVGDEELAHACWTAGLYLEAASLYRRLAEQDPEDDHLAVMLMLCERNGGNAQTVPELLERLQQDEGTSEWAEWMAAMMALSEETDEEAK
jgi:hypothetical protein